MRITPDDALDVFVLLDGARIDNVTLADTEAGYVDVLLPDQSVDEYEEIRVYGRAPAYVKTTRLATARVHGSVRLVDSKGKDFVFGTLCPKCRARMRQDVSRCTYSCDVCLRTYDAGYLKALGL